MKKTVRPIQRLVSFLNELPSKIRVHVRPQEKLIPTFAFHITHWKRPLLTLWFPERRFIFVPINPSEKSLLRKWLPEINGTQNAEVLVWGMNLPVLIEHISTKPIRYIEDGFVRSIGLGSMHTPPLSLNIDTQTPYFNAQKASDLESILATYDFNGDSQLIARAKALMGTLLDSGLSKYNHSQVVDIAAIYGPKTKRRILVIGQVEDDASIKFGCASTLNNNDLVRIARQEHPDAQIIYKPHPDVLHKRRAALSNPDDVCSICTVLKLDIPLSQAFHEIDHVYTITSQSGFEALMRGIKVTTLGCPFYSGWGLTDDRQKNFRRVRKLTLEQIFAAAYILYPKYFSYLEKRIITPEDAIKLLIRMRTEAVSKIGSREITTQPSNLDKIESGATTDLPQQHGQSTPLQQETLRNKAVVEAT